jgi:hypothetical protein
MTDRERGVKLFFETCREQEVELHPVLFDDDVQRAIYSGPNAGLSLIRNFARFLKARKRLDSSVVYDPLANKEVELPPALADDFIMNTAGQIVNASVEPLPADPSVFSLERLKASYLSSCSAAEEGFARTVVQMSKIDPSGKMEAPFQAFTHDDQVVLLRKTDGLPSALSLSEIRLNGVPFPPGSLFSVLTNARVKEDFAYTHGRDKPQILSTNEISELAFLRLSAFAFEPEEREAEGCEFEYEPDVYSLRLGRIASGLGRAIAKLEDIDISKSFCIEALEAA